MPVFPRTTPVSVGSRARSVPLRPATASEWTNASRISGFSRPARMTAASVRAVMRSSEERPEPSTSRTPAVGMSAARISAITIAAPWALVPTAAVERAEVLEEHLRGEVVAVLVHSLHDRRERIRGVRGKGNGVAGRGPEPDAALRRRSCARRVPCAARAPRGAVARATASLAHGRPRARRAAASRLRRSIASIRPPPRRWSNADSSPRIRPVHAPDSARAQRRRKRGDVGGR